MKQPIIHFYECETDEDFVNLQESEPIRIVQVIPAQTKGIIVTYIKEKDMPQQSPIAAPGPRMQPAPFSGQ